MQVHGQANAAAASAGFSKPNAVPATTNVNKPEQAQPQDRVTISPAAKEMSTNVSQISNMEAATATDIQNAEKAISSGSYSVLWTSGGRVVVVIVDT
ncbi:MAG: flagellar biosynthesis anti-sigma factor FlgM [Dissulfurispiraceae bacterium]|jgi:hypothetical protein